MVRTPSTMLPLGSKAPDFRLLDAVSATEISLETFADSQLLLMMFICQHCPFVKHVEQELAKIGHDYEAKSLAICAISSNSIESHPTDAPPYLKEMAERLGFRFPFCFDETQAVAQLYKAACTPDFFLFDQQRSLIYRGQLDDARPGNDAPVTGRDMRAAIDAGLTGALLPDQKPSIG
ncbi:MAG: thioredoxin family protein, partial [Cyanobacteria bacterium P01_F01_bin.42]